MKNEFSEDIINALKVLRAGGVILYPTDTVWGLGCDATNGEAVKKIFSIKKRSDSKSLIVLVNSVGMLTRYVENPPDVALQMAEWSEKPLTVVYDKGRSLADGVASSDGSVGVRICTEPFCDNLIDAFRRPIISTSANISGEDTPAVYDDISEEIINAADYVCRYRQDDRTRLSASSVIRVFANGVIKILRN
ncbi:MAG: threonylcarbamoyl-AMP synthase [Bacteroidia bacterium]|nr:MAG: threonylcarbamoyl-AMP synthase [Bacteroidia bacterium]